MKKILLISFLLMILFPLGMGFSQTTDLPTTLSVTLAREAPFMYKDSEGYSVVVGMVENNNALSAVSQVQIMVTYYDETSPAPLEISSGSTLLEVIPPKGKSPYIIKSDTTNPNISSAEVKLVDFSSSETKPSSLTIEFLDATLTETLKFSGVIKNTGNAPNVKTNVYVAFYDAFIPPRIIGVSTIHIGVLGIEDQLEFTFDERINSKASGMMLFAESDVFNSNIVDVKIPKPELPTRKVMVSDVYVADIIGKPLSKIDLGSTVTIQAKSWIQLAVEDESETTDYTFYAQVKQSGEIPFVEFLGISNGTFTGTQQEFPSVEWTPEKPGIYFIETYVWNRVGVPLADPGPVILVVVI